MKVETFRKAIDFSSSGADSVPIAGQNLLRAIRARIYGVLTITTGGGGSGTVVEDNPATLIKKIALRDGTKEILRVRGEELQLINYYDAGVENEKTAVSSAGDGVTNFYANLKMECVSVLAKIPEATLLLISDFPNLNVEVTFGTVEDLVAGGTRVKTITGCKVDISTIEETLAPGIDREKLEFPVKYLTPVTKVLGTGTIGEIQVDIQAGKALRRIVVVNTNAGVRADMADEDKVDLVLDGSLSLVKGKFAQIQDADKQDYMLGALKTGVFIIDFDEGKDFSGLIDTRGANRSIQLKLDYSVARTAPAKVTAIVEEIEPLA